MECMYDYTNDSNGRNLDYSEIFTNPLAFPIFQTNGKLIPRDQIMVKFIHKFEIFDDLVRL